MEKTYSFTIFGETRKLLLGKTTYSNNGTLAVVAIEVLSDGTEEEFGVITVNLEQSTRLCVSGDCQFIDVNNWGSDFLSQLFSLGICRNTFLTATSGYCQYPLVVFNDKALSSMRAL